MKLFFITFTFLINFASAQGAPSKETYRKAIRENQPELAKCLKLGKFKTSKDKRLVLEWQVDDQGLVRTAKIKKSNMDNMAVHNCILDKVKTLNFPLAPSGQLINIVYQLNFDN